MHLLYTIKAKSQPARSACHMDARAGRSERGGRSAEEYRGPE